MYQLERSEQIPNLQTYLESQFEYTPIGYILYDNQGCITHWNPTAEQIFGYPNSEVIGKMSNELIIPISNSFHAQNGIDHLGEKKR